MTAKIKNCLLSGAFLLYLFLFLQLSAFDLSFSQYLTSVRYEPFVLWGKHIGVLPASMIAAFAFCVIARHYEGKQRYLCISAGYAASVAAAYYICSIWRTDTYMLSAAAAVLLLLLLRKPAERIPLNDETLRICQAGILLAACSVSLTTVLKVIWGRPRFWSLSANMQEYAQWYEISGPVWFADMNKSFPSGHTTAASVILWIRYLPRLDQRLQGKEVFLTVFAGLWIVCTALSRIMAGMHFISDTMAGFAVCCTVYLLIDHYYIRQSSET